MEISEALARYVRQLEADGRSAHTIASAKRHVKMLAAWLASEGRSREVEGVSHETVAAFLGSAVVRERAGGGPRKPASGNAIRSGLRGFFAYAHAVGIASTDAGRLIRRAVCAPPRPKALSQADQARLVAALSQARTQVEQRDRALYLLMLRSGLRVGSALDLDVGDVDLEAGEVRLRRTKGNGDEVAVVPDDVVALLRELIGTRRSGPLFVGHGHRLSVRHVRRRLAAWAQRAGIAGGVHPHQLRHTFGQRTYDATHDLLLVARALGHRSVLSTQAYARASTAAVRRAIAG